MRLTVAILIILILTGQILKAQNLPEYKLDSVTVTAGFNKQNSFLSPRNIGYISKTEIQRIPSLSSHDLFKNISGVDIRRRGIGNTQSDISIRGSSFEQTLVMIDGVPLTDAQTGHHLLDIPMEGNISKIEVLKGSGSRVFGVNAFGGAVNIITESEWNNRLSIQGSAGSFGTYSGLMSIGKQLSGIDNILNLSLSSSNGYRYNTDYKNFSAFYKANFQNILSGLKLSVGFSEKSYGANGFYSLLYPDQWEHTKSGLMIASLENNNMDLNLNWRFHDDEYLLFRNDPQKYRNHHIKNNFGLRAKYKTISEYGLLTFGIESGFETIESNNLGNHERSRLNIFIDDHLEISDKIILSFGNSIHFSSDWSPKMSPGADISIKMSDDIVAFSTAGYSFRAPTYTELYYKSPINEGNAGLKPESSFGYEFGLRYSVEKLQGSFSIFGRKAWDLIDWVKAPESKIWKTENLNKINYTGIEFAFRLNNLPAPLFPINYFKIDYSYIRSTRELSSKESKYLMDHLTHQFLINLDIELFYSIMSNFAPRYEKRNFGGDAFICDLKILRNIGDFDLSLTVTNLFNKSYFEYDGLPLPGRQISALFCYVLQ